ncbi:phosphatase [Sulfurovum sp.]|uniref:Ppx/GppA phosphatase family protein n=1 Tax=Sulfurovum sp. TaxID=1969726 RepID=UPI0025FDF8BC|nr:phosphatase [Sulfurovum sp.]
MRSKEPIIAIDLGSNTLRVLCYDCQTEKVVAEFEKIVKTADGLKEHGFINDAAIGRVITAIKEAKQVIDFSGQRIKAVTTEALRQASNAKEVLSKIEQETGIAFEIISGDKEAESTLLAVKNRLTKLQYASQSFVLADIGGGSTELIFHYPNETISKSFPIGIVTIAQSYQKLENIAQALPKEMFEMQMFCAEVYATKGKVDSFVATAGTPTTVAAMKLGQVYETYDAQKINGTSLNISELDFYLKKLISMPPEEREITVGTGRSDLIAAGILIFKQLFSIVEFESCVVVDDGLREGVALEACRR